jgi:hypothetical protein
VSADSPFVVYSPKSVRKLSYFGDEEELNEELGHYHSGGKDWQPENRAIDCRGRVYGIHYSPADHLYHMEETGEIWDHSKLLAVALADVRLARQDPAVLERRVRDAGSDHKHRVIIEHINTLPASLLTKVLVCLVILLALAFGAAVCYGTVRLVTWLSKS